MQLDFFGVFKKNKGSKNRKAICFEYIIIRNTIIKIKKDKLIIKPNG